MRLEQAAHKKGEQLAAAEARAAIPAAVGALPKRLDVVRAALEQLDRAITDTNAVVDQMVSFAPAGTEFPLDDDALDDLLELRTEVWRARNSRALFAPTDPDARKDFPRSWAATYPVEALGVVRTRRPPYDALLQNSPVEPVAA